MRNAVVQTIYEAALLDPNVCFFTGDFQHICEKEFRALGKRYQNVGMAEQSMIGLASGAALSGKKVFVYSIIPFITLRCIEQIKVDVCGHNVDVTVIGGGAGFTYGTCGITHLAIEDVAMLRSLPQMKVVSPSGPLEAAALTRDVIRVGGPAYLRLNKKGEENLTQEVPIFGKGMIVRAGTDVCIFSTGSILVEALHAAEVLSMKNISVEVVNMHTLKPIDTTLVRAKMLSHRFLCTLEEHTVMGGLGSMVAEIIAESGNAVRFQRFGIQDVWPAVVGSQQFLREYMGISGNKVALEIERLLM